MHVGSGCGAEWGLQDPGPAGDRTLSVTYSSFDEDLLFNAAAETILA